MASPRLLYWGAALGLASGRRSARGNAVWDVWEDCLQRGPLRSRASPESCSVGQKAAFPSATLDHMVTLRMKFCSEDVGTQRQESDGSMELLCQPQTAHFQNFFLYEWIN